MRLMLTGVFLVMILYVPAVRAKGGTTLFIDSVFVLFLIAALTDIVDGIVARTYNASSKFGRMLDPFVDKVLVCGGFICLAAVGEPRLFGFSALTLAIIQWGVAGIITLRELVISYFEHYYNLAREKTLRSYTRPLDLTEFDGHEWLTRFIPIEIAEVEALRKQAPLVRPEALLLGR